MNTYAQSSARSCGPDAFAWALSKLTDQPVDQVREKVYRAWGWKEYHDIRDDLMDSPGQHEAVAKRLGVGFRLGTLGELECGQLHSNTTVMLVHLSAKDPTVQHWIVLAAYASDGKTRWHWGDGQIHELSRNTVREYYSRFSPACIYTLVEDVKQTESLPWYARAWAWLMRKAV